MKSLDIRHLLPTLLVIVSVASKPVAGIDVADAGVVPLAPSLLPVLKKRDEEIIVGIDYNLVEVEGIPVLNGPLLPSELSIARWLVPEMAHRLDLQDNNEIGALLGLPPSWSTQAQAARGGASRLGFDDVRPNLYVQMEAQVSTFGTITELEGHLSDTEMQPYNLSATQIIQSMLLDGFVGGILDFTYPNSDSQALLSISWYVGWLGDPSTNPPSQSMPPARRRPARRPRGNIAAFADAVCRPVACGHMAFRSG